MRRLPGSHVPNIKNRSSKHLGWLTGYRPIVRCLSTAALEELTKDPKSRNWAAKKELERRQKKAEKKAAKGAAA